MSAQMLTIPEPEPSILDKFLRFADSVQAAHERANRPAYSETCACGAVVEVSRDVPAAERRRIHATFVGRHNDCTPARGDRR